MRGRDVSEWHQKTLPTRLAARPHRPSPVRALRHACAPLGSWTPLIIEAYAILAIRFSV